MLLSVIGHKPQLSIFHKYPYLEDTKLHQYFTSTNIDTELT